MNWGRFGDEDERGMLNLLTPEVVLAATHTPRTGKVYSLALPIRHDGVPYFDHRGAPSRLSLSHQSDRGQFVEHGAPEHVGSNEDVLIIASHNGTHIDAFSHVFAEHTMYNGVPAEAVSAGVGATKLGIDKVPGIVGRAVLLDLVAHLGADVALDNGYAITSDDLEACARSQGTEVRAGDILLVRTGWVDRFLTLGVRGPTDVALVDDGGQPGIGIEAMDFIDAHDIVAVGSDNSAVEVLGRDEGVFLEVHVALLVQRGIHLLEHLVLPELAADRCYECLFVVAPLQVVGASGSPINPIAIG